MNEIIIKGFVNKLKNNNFLLNYKVKKNNEFHQVKIKCKKSTQLILKNNNYYILKGFFSSIKKIKHNKQINIPILFINQIDEVKTNFNQIILKCKIIKIIKLSNNNTFGTLIYKIKKNNQFIDTYISFVGIKKLELPLYKTITIKGFLSGDIWYENNVHNIKHTKSKIFISEII